MGCFASVPKDRALTLRSARGAHWRLRIYSYHTCDGALFGLEPDASLVVRDVALEATRSYERCRVYIAVSEELSIAADIHEEVQVQGFHHHVKHRCIPCIS